MKKMNRGQAKKAAVVLAIMAALAIVPSVIPEVAPLPNVAPTTPCMSGPSVVRAFAQAEFVTMSKDNDTVAYTLDWGDGSNSSASLPGGQYWHVTHAWTFPGKYIIQAKAVDSNGAEALGCMKMIAVN